MIFFHLFCFWWIKRVIASEVPRVDDFDMKALSSSLDPVTKDNSVEFGFEMFNSFNIPIDKSSPAFHAVTDVALLNKYASANSFGFYESIDIDPLSFYERPNAVLLKDPLLDLCANFRASKTSTDPAAFEKTEKRKFIDAIHDLGVFNEPGNVLVKKGNKKTQESQDNVNFRCVYSSVIVTSHFCRDALRIVADVLDRSQIKWLLDHSTSAVLNNPGFMDALNDFSMFSAENVTEAVTKGHYDWYKNTRALQTLSPAALIALFRVSNYDLSVDQMNLLIASRPLEELFKQPEFINDPFVWQVNAGIPNVDKFVELIESDFTCPANIKQILFALYVHTENVINHQQNGIVNVIRFIPMDYVSKLPIFPMYQFQMNIINMHLFTLDQMLSLRSHVLVVLMRKFENLNVFDEESKNLLSLLTTPLSYVSRKALAVYEDLKKEYPEKPTVEDLHRALLALNSCDPSEFKYYLGYAHIFAYYELVSSPVKLPYRVNYEIESSLTMIHKLRKIYTFGSSEFDNVKPYGKWERLYLILIGIDFKAGKGIQIADHGEGVENTLDVIFKGFMVFCDFSTVDDNFMGILRNYFPEQFDDVNILVQSYKDSDLLFQKFRDEFIQLSQVYYETRDGCKLVQFAMNSTLYLGIRESKILSLIQNCFKVEMAASMLDDTEFTDIFSDFAYLISRAQVAELLKSELGKKLLASSRKLVHNLPTYEDFTSAQVSELKLQAQYATMVRTLPLIPLLVSFKTDNYIFNDPLALSVRLITESSSRWGNQELLLLNAWKFVPFQAIAEFWGHGLKTEKNVENVAMISNYLKGSNEVKGKGLLSCQAILHWLIISELRAVEAFVLINSQNNEKWQAALNTSILLNHFEHGSRDFLLQAWISAAASFKEIIDKLRPGFLRDVFELVSGPIAPVRGGIFLAARGIMDKNLRMLQFNEYFLGFYDWVAKTVKAVKLAPVEVQQSTFNSETIAAYENAKNGKHSSVKSEESSKYVVKPATISSKNIPQYREYIEVDCKSRRELLFKMLKEINLAFGIEDDSNLQIWKDRLDLLGMMSADGFTVNPSYNLESNFNLPLHESILHYKLKVLAGLIGGENLPEDLKPEKLGIVVVENCTKTSEPSKEEGKKNQSTKGKKGKRK